MKIKILLMMDFFLKKTIEAIDNFFIKMELANFDAHVGDTLCQIRAYKTWLMSIEDDVNTKKRIGTLEINKFRKFRQCSLKNVLYFKKLISENSGYNKELDSKEKLNDFLKNRSLMFVMSEDVFLIAIEYLLNFYSLKDDLKITMAIDCDKFLQELDVGKTLAKKIMRSYQQKLSKISCEFVLELSKDLKNFKEINFMLPYLQLQDHHKRSVLPCYEVTKILIEHAVRNSCPFVVVSYRKCTVFNDVVRLVFVPNQGNNGYAICEDLQEIDVNSPCIVMHGLTVYQNNMECRTEFIKHFLKLGLIKIILANMANHPQYSANEFSIVKDNPYDYFLKNNHKNVFSQVLMKNDSVSKSFVSMSVELEKNLLEMQQLGRMEGCCIENPSLFFVKHIFCDIIKNQVGLKAVSNYQKDEMFNVPIYQLHQKIQENILG